MYNEAVPSDTTVRVTLTKTILWASAIVLAAVGSCSAAAPPSTFIVNVPATKPPSAVVVPQAFLPNFDNEFSGILVSSLAARMSKPPVLRVGGTSGDRFRYSASQKEARVCLQPPLPKQQWQVPSRAQLLQQL